MIIKRLLVPLINRKILQQAEYCYIATSAISTAGFDMLMSKLPGKTKVDMVTDLDLPTDPTVLRKILNQYPDRVTLTISTKNPFHPNVYVFDLPYRKRIAFIGSGNLTLGGLKDDEELFSQVDSEKEVEEIKSWFNSYFEYSEPLTETIINEYETLYHSIKARDSINRQEKEQFIDLIIGKINWEHIDFTKQYFEKEDYLTFENSKSYLNTPIMRGIRTTVQGKLLALHNSLKDYLTDHNLHANSDTNLIVSNLDPIHHHEHKVNAMWLCYGRSDRELSNYKAQTTDLMHFQIMIRQQDVEISLVPGKQYRGKEDRDYFQSEMQKTEYRTGFYNLLKGLGNNYRIEIAGEQRQTDSFENENKLWAFTTTDHVNYRFMIKRKYFPGDPGLSSTEITTTIMGEFNKLLPLYKYMKNKAHEQ